MHRMRLTMLLLGSCLPLSLSLQAADSTGTTMANMMRGMITGLNLLGQAGNTPGYGYSGLPGTSWPGTAWPGTPWAAPGMYPSLYPPMYPPMYPPGGTLAAPYAGAPAYNQRNANLLRLLQGSWETNNGGLLLVKGQLARLYLSRDRFQDLELTVDQHYVWMRPAGTGQTRRYEHRIFDKRVILRDEEGKVLLLQRYSPSQQFD